MLVGAHVMTNEGMESRLQQLARIYRDEQQEPGHRQAALVAVIRVYCGDQERDKQAAETGDLLAELLAPVIRATARRVARGATRDERTEFADEALALIVARRQQSPARICTYQEDRGLFESWLR